jgi:hypothetical protein
MDVEGFTRWREAARLSLPVSAEDGDDRGRSLV